MSYVVFQDIWKHKYYGIRPTVEDVVQAQGGDKDAIERVVVGTMGLVIKVSSRYRREGACPADVFQNAVLYVMEAIRRFDASKGCQWVTYAMFWIHLGSQHALADSLVVSLPRGKRIPVTGGEAVEKLFADYPPEDTVEQEEVWDIAMTALNEREQLIVLGRMSGMTQRELARELNVSPERIRQLYNRALSRMKTAVLGEERSLCVA